MPTSPDDEPFNRVLHKMEPQSTLLRVRALTGGISAHMTALEFERLDGQRATVVVRRHGEADRRRNPDIAADEFTLLRLLQSKKVAAPTPIYLDRSGEIFSTPYIVVDYIEGTTGTAQAIGPDQMLQLATHLASIHAIDCSRGEYDFLPKHVELYAEAFTHRPAPCDESLSEGHIRDTLESVWPLPPRNESVLLHGDFWPGNTVWRDGQLVAVVDWEDARCGDPLEDVANTRLEVLWAFGVDAMDRFTDAYRSMTTIDFTHLPYWDLCAALRPASTLAKWAGDEVTERTMRDGHAVFVLQALDALPAR